MLPRRVKVIVGGSELVIGEEATWRKNRPWARVLAYVSGLVNEELLLPVEYLAAEDRILRVHLPDRLQWTNEERCTLAEIGKRLGRKGLPKMANVAKPVTILGWFRKLVAQKFDGSTYCSDPGRLATSPEVVRLIVRPCPGELQLGIRSHRGCAE
jgi:putative transposase